MEAIEITTATPADAADAIRLFGALHQFNANLDPRFELAHNWEALVRSYLEQSVDARDSAWLLARHRGTAVGFVLVEVHTDSPLYRHRRWAEIVGLYVEPDLRGSNLAHVLMQHAYDWALQHRLGMMQLYVTAANDQAQRFYAKQGFTTSQVIMRRTISPDDAQDQTLTEHPHHRLHFSEGGDRPLDMHGHVHHDEQ